MNILFSRPPPAVRIASSSIDKLSLDLDRGSGVPYGVFRPPDESLLAEMFVNWSGS